ncbi:unnamed protein product [Schistosoma margrebowiei]|uniref:Uncharacterized protein n=1 Tax=Schistosoma margrebowiei TaxID=48269 RepID=A0A183MB79_9TREM|nr:unnamed protein product [Schistosoma margrebowiei]
MNQLKLDHHGKLGSTGWPFRLIAGFLSGGSDADVKARAAYLQMKNIWNLKQLSTNTKVRIFNTNVKTVLLYGTETQGTMYPEDTSVY